MELANCIFTIFTTRNAIFSTGAIFKHEFKRSILINIILGRQLTLALVKTLFAVVLLSIALAYTFKIVITARYALNSEDLASLIALLE